MVTNRINAPPTPTHIKVELLDSSEGLSLGGWVIITRGVVFVALANGVGEGDEIGVGGEAV